MERMLAYKEKANKAFRIVEEEMRDEIVLAIRRDFEDVLGPLRRDLTFKDAVNYELAKRDEITIRRFLAKKQGLKLLSPHEYLSVIAQREAAEKDAQGGDQAGAHLSPEDSQADGHAGEEDSMAEPDSGEGKGDQYDNDDEYEEDGDPAFWNLGFKDSYDKMLHDERQREAEEGSRFLGLRSQEGSFMREVDPTQGQAKRGTDVGGSWRGGLLGLLPDKENAAR